MRLAFAILLTVHGLIHLIGFAKAFQLAELPQLTRPIPPLIGVMWLAAAVLFLFTAGALFAWPRWWWAIGAGAIAVSMVAIVEVYRFTADGLDRAQKLVDAGLSLIGENSLLLATRGMVSWYYLNFSIRPEDRYLDEAAAYAARALERDPQHYVGIFLRGLVASKRGDMESAIRDLHAAHEQKPGDAMVLNELIRHHLSAGQEHTESARPVYEAALRVDPLHPLNWAQWSWRHFSAGRLAEAVDAARRIFHLTDRGNPARVYAAYYLALANEREEAIAVFEAEGSALPDTAYGSVSLFLSRALQGDGEGAVRHISSPLEQAAAWTEYLALFLADGYSLIGRNDEAIRWLRTAVALGFINYPILSTRDPFLASLRSDPRFEELMRTVKPRWRWGSIWRGRCPLGSCERSGGSWPPRSRARTAWFGHCAPLPGVDHGHCCAPCRMRTT